MDAAKKNILVVEDDEDSRTLICTMVRALGFNPISFPGGKEALAGIKGQPIALALLDIMMPDMNGYEVMAAIKKIPEFASLPVIMVTAKDRDSEVLEGYQHGADYYITKPFSKQQLQYGIQLFVS